MKLQKKHWLTGTLIVAVTAGLFFYRHSAQMRPYREWITEFETALNQPITYGLTTYVNSLEETDLQFDRRVFKDGQSAYEEFDFGGEGNRKVLVQPAQGTPKSFVIAANGQGTEASFGSGFTSVFAPFDSWQIGTTPDSPLWTLLTNANLLHAPLGLYNLSWDQFSSLPARKVKEEDGLLTFEISVPTQSRSTRAQPVIMVYLDPQAGNQLVRTTAGFKGEPPVQVNHVVSWQKSEQGHTVPHEISFSYANQEIRYRIENPTLGSVPPNVFDVTKFERQKKR